MGKALALNVKGIKCDNKECDYAEPNVSPTDYGEWLNKPCPKCGANLLTQKDYDTVTAMANFINTINRLLPETDEGTEKVKVPIEMNGSGKIFVKLQKEAQA